MTRDEHEAQKFRWKQYRQAAERLYGTSLRPGTMISENASKTGAYVEIVVWVPKEEADKETV